MSMKLFRPRATTLSAYSPALLGLYRQFRGSDHIIYVDSLCVVNDYESRVIVQSTNSMLMLIGPGAYLQEFFNES